MDGKDNMATEKIRIGDLPLLGRLCIYSEFVYGLCNGAWSIALSFHLSANGVSEREIGVLLCAGYLVTAMASFFVGRIGDQRGFPFVMGIGALLMGAGLLAITWVHQLPLYYAAHGMYCVGLACLMSMEFNLPLSLLREEQKQYGYNLVLVFFFLGGMAGNFLCGLCLPLFPNQEDPYRYILQICGVSYLLLAVFRGMMPRQAVAGGQKPGSVAFHTLLQGRRVPSYLLYGFLTFGLLTLSTGLLNLVLRLWHGLPDRVIGMVFSVNSLVGCLMLMVLPKLILRASLHSISRVALTAQLLAFIGMSFLPGGPFVGMIYLRTISCNILYTTVDSPMLQSIEPQVRGTYAGMRVFANYVGMSLASVVSGWLVDMRLFRGLFLTCAAVGLAQLLTYFLLCRPFLARSEREKADAFDRF